MDEMFETDIELPNQELYEVTQQVVRDYMDDDRKSIEYVAEKLGTSKGYLYKQLDPNQTNRPLSIDRIVGITKLTDDMRIIEEICHMFGGTFVPHNLDQNTISNLEELSNDTIIESGEVHRTIIFARRDGEIDDNELLEIIESAEDAADAAIRIVKVARNERKRRKKLKKS